MSKQDSKPRAKEMYCIHHMSLADIGRALDVSTRTLQNWKSEDMWEEERTRISGSEGAFHGEIFKLGETMARQIRIDEEAGIKVSPERYSALRRVIDTANKAKDYEADGSGKPPDNGKSKQEKQAAAMKRAKQLFGVRG